MARKVFFSFQYEDVQRAMIVRNSDVIKSDDKVGFIDKAEFEKVEREGDAKNNAEEKTASPWIYHELNTSRIIRRNPLTRERLLIKSTSLESRLAEDTASIRVEYPAPLAHLAHINTLDIENWSKRATTKGGNKLEMQ